MRVDVTDMLSVKNKVAERDVCIDLDAFESKLGTFPITQKAPFVLTLTNEENEFLFVEGETDVTIAIPCDRCLEEVSVDLHLVVDRKFSLKKTEMPDEEVDAEEIDEFEGSTLCVDNLIYDEILVNWPMKVLCREDCKGICRKCGANLNLTTCTCDRTELDPRMAAIQDIFNQFKEV